jgi:hypothetical protein
VRETTGSKYGRLYAYVRYLKGLNAVRQSGVGALGPGKQSTGSANGEMGVSIARTETGIRSTLVSGLALADRLN